VWLCDNYFLLYIAPAILSHNTSVRGLDISNHLLVRGQALVTYTLFCCALAKSCKGSRSESVVSLLEEFAAKLRPKEYFCNILMPGNASGDNYIESFCADQSVIIGASLSVLD